MQQNDHLLANLTVRESLRYTADLRLSGKRSVKHALVDTVIQELGLDECSDTIIGDAWRKGISGGQKRRVSVAAQMLVNPPLLFLDEVTTGLDAFTSLRLVETLKDLAASTRTIFITIHQPRGDIYTIFDSIILLSGGHPVYIGRAGHVVIDYFKKLGYVCSNDTNPADFLIDLTAIDTRDAEREAESRKRVAKLVNQWAEEVASRRDLSYAFVREDALGGKEEAEMRKNDKIVTKGAGLFAQTFILVRRSWTNQIRDSLMLWGNLVECVVVGLVFGAVFYNLGQDLPGVLSRKGALYVVASIQTYLQLIFVVYKTSSDFKVFDRERSDRSYAVVPYVAGSFIAQLPFNIIFPTIFAIISYFIMVTTRLI